MDDARICSELNRELRRKQHDLALARERFDALVMENADAMIVIDEKGEVIFSNRAANRLFLCDESALIGRNLGIPLVGAESTRIEIPRLNNDPIVADARVTKTMWRGRTATILTLRDVSLREREEAALWAAKQSAEYANRMKTQFLANMSHELRTPLNSILGFTELIRSETFGPMVNDKYRGYVDDIHNSGRYLLELINELLDLSKAEAGKLELREEDFDIVATLRAAIRTVKTSAEKKSLVLDARFDSDAITFRGDEQKTTQIFLNLLSNAIKFTPENGVIHIQSNRRGDGYLQIAVSDNGVGIPADKIAKVFQPFAQIQDADHNPHMGTGLGLALTKRLVELHNGSIKLSSTIGEGSTVTLSFPPMRLPTLSGQTALYSA